MYFKSQVQTIYRSRLTNCVFIVFPPNNYYGTPVVTLQNNSKIHKRDIKATNNSRMLKTVRHFCSARNQRLLTRRKKGSFRKNNVKVLQTSFYQHTLYPHTFLYEK